MKKNIFSLFTSIIIFSSEIISQSLLNYYPFNHIDVMEYKIDIDLTESFVQKKNILSGSVNILCVVDTTSLQEVYLDAVSLIIDSVFVDNERAEYNSTVNYLIIFLNDEHKFGDSLNLKIFYKRVTGDTPGYYLRVASSQNQYIAFTASWQTNTRYWLPCKDWPIDKAFVKMKVKVPKDIYAVSNGALIERIETDNYSVFTWQDSHPMATYVITVSAGDYSSLEEKIPRFSNSSDSIKITYHTFQDDIPRFLELLENTHEIIDFYSYKFFEFPFDNLNFVVPGTRFLGMSNQTVIQFSTIPPQIDSFYTDYVIPHEIAHQWFGNYINSADWNLWLTEGLADYASLLYRDFLIGNKFLRNIIRQRIYFYLQFDSISVNDGNYSRLTPVLEMLRTTIGDSLYWKSFKYFLNTYNYGSATIRDFTKAVNETTGKNYDWFSDQWFYKSGHPKYIISWKLEKIFDGYYTYLKIEQTQTFQDLFIMPVDITFITEKGDTTIQIFNNERVQSLEFRLNSKLLDVIFDKDTLLFLKEVEYENTTFTPFYSYFLKQNYPNPFNPNTKIEYSISNFEFVNLKIYDILGREIRTLVNEEKQPGVYGVEFDASQLSSGIYFYKLDAGSFSETRKMILLK